MDGTSVKDLVTWIGIAFCVSQAAMFSGLNLVIGAEGEVVDPRSILVLPVSDGRPEFPAFELSRDDPFVRQVAQSGRKWVILTDPNENPLLVMDADEFLRGSFSATRPATPMRTATVPWSSGTRMFAWAGS